MKKIIIFSLIFFALSVKGQDYFYGDVYMPYARFLTDSSWFNRPVKLNNTITTFEDLDLLPKWYIDANYGGGSLPSGIQGDIVYHNGSNWVPLNAGTNGYYLQTQGSGANPLWSAVSGLTSPLTTKGDIWTYSTTDDRLPVGEDGQIMVAASYESTGLKWLDAVEQTDIIKKQVSVGGNNSSLWLLSPKAHFYNGNIYFCYLDFDDDLRKIARYDYATATWTVNTWTQTSVTGSNQDKAHAAPTMFMDGNGYVHVAYSEYIGGAMYTVRSTNPDDITSFQSEVTVETSIPAASYPTIFQKGSTLVLFYRGRDANSLCLSRAISSDNGSTWTNIIDITEEYPYHQTRIDENDRVHISYHIKPGSENENVYYLYSDDIENASPTFYEIDGTLRTIPVTSSQALVFNSSIYDNCYLLGVDADNMSDPHIFAYLSDVTEDNHLAYFSYRGSSWQKDTIEVGDLSSWTAGSIQGDVQFKNDSGLYLMHEYISDPTYGTYGKSENKEWVSYDYGETWKFLRYVTANTPTTTANPLYVRESGEPMWFEGSNDYGVGKEVYIGFEPNSRFNSPVTYNALPVSPNRTPTKDYEMATKKYVDDNAGVLPSGIQGDIMYHNGVSWVTLTAGTNGYFLQTQGSGANPLWAAGGGSSYWTQTGSDIYYNTGNVGIGRASSINYPLHIGAGTEAISSPAADILINNNGRADIVIRNSSSDQELSISEGTTGTNFVQRQGTYITFSTIDASSYVAFDAESGTDEMIVYNAEIKFDATKYSTQGTISNGDATPDVSGYNFFRYSPTSSSVTITNLDNARTGAEYILMGTSDTYTVTINDAGNFNMTGTIVLGEDDIVKIFCAGTNTFVQSGAYIDN